MKQRLAAFGVVLFVVLSLALTFKPPVSMAADPLGSSTLIINGGGGVQTNGSDGQKIIFNNGGSGEQLRFAGKGNYYPKGGDSANVDFVLAVGTSTYGTRLGANTWTTKSVLALSGTASTTGTSGQGSGYALLQYTAVVGELTYVVEREITYTYPNRFFQENFTVTILQGTQQPSNSTRVAIPSLVVRTRVSVHVSLIQLKRFFPLNQLRRRFSDSVK